MAYVDPNYKTKKEFKAAVEAGRKHYPYNPSGLFPTPTEGAISIEGPHYPQAHKWYASCVVKAGIIVSVK
jgi:hypothetical protein